MKRQWTIVIGIVVVLLAVVAMLVRNAPPRVEVGVRAPDFTALDLATNKPVSLHADFGGTVTLVNVWATYCEPCKQEIPAMDSLFRELGGKGFRIAAVSIDPGSADKVRAFAREYHITFDVLHDPAADISAKYQTTGVPESFLVGRDGRIVRIVQHAAAWNSPEVRRIVEDLLAEPAR